MYKDCNILLKICFNIIKIAPTKAHYSTRSLHVQHVQSSVSALAMGCFILSFYLSRTRTSANGMKGIDVTWCDCDMWQVSDTISPSGETQYFLLDAGECTTINITKLQIAVLQMLPLLQLLVCLNNTNNINSRKRVCYKHTMTFGLILPFRLQLLQWYRRGH